MPGRDTSGNFLGATLSAKTVFSIFDSKSMFTFDLC